MQNDFTGGLLPLAGVGKMSPFSAPRDIPVTGHRSPTGGRRRNSICAGLMLAGRAGISSGAVVAFLSLLIVSRVLICVRTLERGKSTRE